ncbi:MAG: FAD-binding oxidoreductase, partial [Hyphomicrobiaceae bacterium]
MAMIARRAPVRSDVLERLKSVVGPAGAIEDPADIAPYCRAWRGLWTGEAPLVLRPANTEEVAALVRICAETGTAIVPQGGLTGLTGASQPHDDRSEVIISTSRMRRIRGIDTANDTMTVDA